MWGPVFFSHGLLSIAPHQCSPVLTSERASPLSAARGEGAVTVSSLGTGPCKGEAANSQGPKRKPPEPTHGGAWHCASLCMFKASYLLLLPMSVKAAGTWHFCKSDFQVFSRHSEKKKTHLWATCSQTSWRPRQICTNQFLVTDGLSTQQAKSSNSFCVVDCTSHMHHFQPLFLQKMS